ncbi:hypothetical protein MLD38_004067 [Melastoma candidum]|uniref:Uncharacterized protein n=1 Tax=Melastoma candidum TaxID=119954 RepID=A0ACB9S7R4_9MYRT|nr:hypothetical protein MLD38_004067 [Melastoma candidum]
MEFWGVEVKAGKPLKVDTEGKLLHLSQASLGEWKNGKGSDSVPVHVKFGGQKLVLGTLSPEKIPQLSFDLVFEKEFELSHNWKSGSVYFFGYLSSVQEEDDFSEDEFDDSEEEDELELPVIAAENGKAKSKPAAADAKQNQQPKPKASTVEPMKVDQEDSDDDDDEEDDDDSSDDEGSDSEDDSEDIEETPKKAESGKKRSLEPVAKTPTPNKKAKPSTPQKTDGKKGAHEATPHPAKQTGKKDKSKSPGQLIRKSSNKTFSPAAKHGAK